MLEAFYIEGILKKAVDKGLIDIKTWDLRVFTDDRHKTVDDYQYGGGVGMVLKVEPIVKAVNKIKQFRNKDLKVILTSPAGNVFNQKMAQQFSEKEGLIIICGRYEGVDERIKELVVDYEVCIGDYILTGGEIAALAIMESTCRLVPNVLEKEDAKLKESFVEGLLDYPHYTRPAEFAGVNVPEVLLSGNHLKIEEWRAKKSLELTLTKRPDILKGNYELQITNDE